MRKTLAAGWLATAMLGQGALAHPHTEDHNPHACVPPAQWFSTETGKAITNKQAITRLADSQAVLLGEDHDNAEHHRWQLQTLIQIYAYQPHMAIGFESFPRRLQPILDRWVAGDYTEQEFLDAVDWENVWSYDANYYMPMFNFARMYKIPMIALNIDRDLIAAVGREGWDNVPEMQREGITKPAMPSRDYLELLATIFERHGSAHGAGQDNGDDESGVPDGPRFKRFVESQQVWDRAMAEGLQEALQAPDVELAVGISGAGHIMGGYGIPHQLKDLGITRIGSALPWGDNMYCDQLRPELADVVFGVNTPKQGKGPDKPRLGVFLEQSKAGVLVRKVVEDSIAQAIGIQADDLIISAAGRPINKVGELIDVVQKTELGTWLPLVIQRDGERKELVAKFPAPGGE